MRSREEIKRSRKEMMRDSGEYGRHVGRLAGGALALTTAAHKARLGNRKGLLKAAAHLAATPAYMFVGGGVGKLAGRYGASRVHRSIAQGERRWDRTSRLAKLSGRHAARIGKAMGHEAKAVAAPFVRSAKYLGGATRAQYQRLRARKEDSVMERAYEFLAESDGAWTLRDKARSGLRAIGRGATKTLDAAAKFRAKTMAFADKYPRSVHGTAAALNTAAVLGHWRGAFKAGTRGGMAHVRGDKRARGLEMLKIAGHSFGAGLHGGFAGAHAQRLHDLRKKQKESAGTTMGATNHR